MNEAKSQALKSAADHAMAAGRQDQALTLYAQAYALNSTNVDAAYAAAKIYDRQATWPKTILWLRRTLALDPYKFDAWNTLGWVYCAEKDYVFAIKTFSRVKALEPTSPVPYYDLAQCYASNVLKQYAKARGYYEKAMKLDPQGTIGSRTQTALNGLPRG